MTPSCILFVFLPLLLGYISADLAPGKLTIRIIYKSKTEESNSENVFLHSKIETVKQVLYNREDQMKSLVTKKEELEVTISFNINNITEALTYEGILKFSTKFNSETHKVFQFQKQKLQYLPSVVNSQLVVPASLYSQNLEKELDVVMSAKCRSNYYPEHRCSVLCILTQNTAYCDPQGTKICKKGYYLNKVNSRCEHDWCWMTTNPCKNNGICINRERDFICSCNSFYTGNYCENYQDICKNYLCPNKSICTVKNEKIFCQLTTSETKVISSNVSLFKDVSIFTILIVLIFIVILIITVGVTIWACRPQKQKIFRSAEQSINSGQSYYATNSISKASNPCLHFSKNGQHCLCFANSFCDRPNYYSMRNPGTRMMTPWNRAYSDLIIPSMDRKYSLSSSVPNEDLLPPPPPPINFVNDDEILL